MLSQPRYAFYKGIVVRTALAALMLISVCFPLSASAEIATLDEFKKLGEKFDHLTTGFALTGDHSLLECGECHIGGVFEALPRRCNACHDNVIAAGMPDVHVETTAPCDTCHTTSGFIATAIMDHGIINGACSSCHDGISATGKFVGHIGTTDLCESCHSSNIWSPVIDVNHGEVFGSCVTCHDGVTASGKNASHIPTADVCEACHDLSLLGKVWEPVAAENVNHNFVIGSCSFCHDGTIATGKGPGHIQTLAECSACHSPPPTGTGWTAQAVDHEQFVATGKPCFDCHNGVDASGKNANHIESSNRCEACHSAGTVWAPVIRVDHNEVNGSCTNCHDNDKPNDQLHNNVSNVCDACHSSGDQWSPALRVDHGEVILPCQQCHDGVVATGKDANHIDTTSDCGVCHNTLNWDNATTNHAEILARGDSCISCHNGQQATGKSQNHINSSDECQACHQAGGTWSTNNVDHAQVFGSCESCHNKSNNHISTSNACDACHVTAPGLWSTINNVDHAQVLGDCSGCHSKDNGHINTSNQCNACHSTDTWEPVITVDHLQVQGSCFNCHNGAIAVGKTADHVDVQNVCEGCHSTIRWKPVITVDHAYVNGSCSSCHDKSNNHPSTSNDCAGCHRSTDDWSRNIRVNHDLVLPGSCSSCHNGNIAEGKDRGHCPTNQECDVCHTSTDDWDKTSRDC
ncbi:MAG: hypothetical protein GXP08_16565 [Gammaproteobacteria bacterium]|nr:hypothetical protein [Gammaproteobacteria bacterium]